MCNLEVHAHCPQYGCHLWQYLCNPINEIFILCFLLSFICVVSIAQPGVMFLKNIYGFLISLLKRNIFFVYKPFDYKIYADNFPLKGTNGAYSFRPGPGP